MASTSYDDATKGLKSTLTKNNAVYLTIKPDYTGSWYRELSSLSNVTGVSPAEVIKQNPWLATNVFPQNNNAYVPICIKGRSSGDGGSGGGDINDIPEANYETSGWVHPLGTGKWKCTTGFKSTHTALDFTTGTPGQIMGYPIYATKAGTVVRSYKSDSWGYVIMIRHDSTVTADGNCYYSLYAHMLNTPKFAEGAKCSQGDLVGYVGNTGHSTGPHLHFQIYFTSATRTDYGNFHGDSDFGVDPNSIPNFPGSPWVENGYSQVNFNKSEFITEEENGIILDAVAQGGEFPSIDFTNTVNNITNRVLEKFGIKANSDLGKVIVQYIHDQFENARKTGLEAIYQLINGGDFYTVFNNTVTSIVNNAIYYMLAKVGNVLENATIEFISNTKQGLFDWVCDSSRIDPESPAGQSLHVYLNSYVDIIVRDGWSAVQTAINTGDVAKAIEVLINNVYDDTVDFAGTIITHGCINAITSYIPTVIQNPDIAQVAVDLSVGIVNVTVQSIGGVLKGDISLAQAAKNILSQAVISVTTVAVQQFIAPYLIQVITEYLVQGISTALGTAIGGPAGALIGSVVGLIVNGLFGFLLQKLVGFFTQ